jgi:hypothetical protein
MGEPDKTIGAMTEKLDQVRDEMSVLNTSIVMLQGVRNRVFAKVGGLDTGLAFEILLNALLEQARDACEATRELAEAADRAVAARENDEDAELPKSLVDAVHKWRTYFRSEQSADSHQKGEK